MRMRRKSPTQRRSQRGLAATEFAVLLPMTLTLLFGAVTVYDAFRGTRLMTTAVSTTIDVASRQQVMTSDVINELYDTAEVLMGSFAEDMDFEISYGSVTRPIGDANADANQTLVMDWFFSRRFDDTPSTRTYQLVIDRMTIPTLSPGDSVLFAEYLATYDPTFLGDYSGSYSFVRTATRRPRYVQRVLYQGN